MAMENATSEGVDGVRCYYLHLFSYDDAIKIMHKFYRDNFVAQLIPWHFFL